MKQNFNSKHYFRQNIQVRSPSLTARDYFDSSLDLLSLPLLILTTPASPQLDRSTICGVSVVCKIDTFLRAQSTDPRMGISDSSTLNLLADL